MKSFLPRSELLEQRPLLSEEHSHLRVYEMRVVTCTVSRFLVHKTSLCAAGEDEVASSLGGYI
jgi:hypothetical protein